MNEAGGRRGFEGLNRALELGPDGVIAELEASGLRGGGSAAYPIARRWRACRDAHGEHKYVVCNAVDTDPLVSTARLLLKDDPDPVLEGLLIAACAIGATDCAICIGVDDAAGAAALDMAIARLGEGRAPIDDGPVPSLVSDILVKKMPASLVSGEETAIIRALEDRQPLPYFRGEAGVGGVRGEPTLVESAETLAAAAAVFRRVGVTTADGMAAVKAVTVAGDVPRPRTLEVALGTTIAVVLELAAGGPLSTLGIKAVQFGGPTGRFFAGHGLLTPISYDDLDRLDCPMGSGSLRVFAAGRCAVEMVREIMARLHEESCGQCVFCREGSRQLLDLVDDIAECRSGTEQIELMCELAEAMKTSCICDVGRQASVPLLSAMELFPEDFESHVQGKRCPEKNG